MLSVSALFHQGQISDAALFATLLTIESLLFGAMGITLGLSAPQAFVRNLGFTPSKSATRSRAW